MAQIENLLYDFIRDNEIATEDEISLVTNINGWSEESLNDIIHCRTEYHDVPQLYACEPENYYFSEELLEAYNLTGDEEEDEEEEEDWLDHAHDVLDENFPEEDELVKDDFCCEHWQNGLSDEDNIANFKEYVKSIAED